jgi:hypothetical protein
VTSRRHEIKISLNRYIADGEAGNHHVASQFFCPACFPPIQGLRVKTDAEPRNWGKPKWHGVKQRQKLRTSSFGDQVWSLAMFKVPAYDPFAITIMSFGILVVVALAFTF